MTKTFLAYILLINLVTFFTFGADKRRAEKNRERKNKLRRVPEKTLLLLALLGGSTGAYAGMQFFRHKTQHKKFKYGVPAIIVAQIVIVFRALFR